MVQLLKILFAFLILTSLVLAQPSIKLEFIGYGKSPQEIYISIRNDGNETISDVTLYVDGEVYKTIEGTSEPGAVFEEVLFLEEGEHLIEARTPEGAYSALNVIAMKGEIEEKVEEEKGLSIYDYYLIGIILLIALIGSVIWLRLKRR